jgi:hypothetical protein
MDFLCGLKPGIQLYYLAFEREKQYHMTLRYGEVR